MGYKLMLATSAVFLALLLTVGAPSAGAYSFVIKHPDDQPYPDPDDPIGGGASSWTYAYHVPVYSHRRVYAITPHTPQPHRVTLHDEIITGATATRKTYDHPGLRQYHGWLIYFMGTGVVGDPRWRPVVSGAVGTPVQWDVIKVWEGTVRAPDWVTVRVSYYAKRLLYPSRIEHGAVVYVFDPRMEHMDRYKYSDDGRYTVEYFYCAPALHSIDLTRDYIRMEYCFRYHINLIEKWICPAGDYSAVGTDAGKALVQGHIDDKHSYWERYISDWSTHTGTVANWYRPLFAPRNAAITGFMSVENMLRYWNTVGFEQGSLGLDLSDTGLQLNSAYTEGGKDLAAADSAFTEMGRRGWRSTNSSGAGALKAAFEGLSAAFKNAENAYYRALLGGSPAGWLGTALSWLNKVSNEYIAPAGASISTAEAKDIPLADRGTVSEYARALFLLGKLGSAAAEEIIIGIPPADPLTEFLSFMGRYLYIPAQDLANAKTSLDHAVANKNVMDSAYQNILATYVNPPNGVVPSNWAVQFQTSRGQAVVRAEDALSRAGKSVEETARYNSDGRRYWGQEVKELESRLNRLKEGASPEERLLYEAAYKLYQKSLVHAGNAGWV